jgi:hypothetical protein
VITQLPRNRWANVALWLVLASWLLLIFRAIVGDLGSINSALDWLFLFVILAALAIATAGVAGIRAHGEALLAITVLGFSLVLPGLYLLAFVLMGLLSGGTAD